MFRPQEIGPIEESFALGQVDILCDNEMEAGNYAKKYLSYFQVLNQAWHPAKQNWYPSTHPPGIAH